MFEESHPIKCWKTYVLSCFFSLLVVFFNLLRGVIFCLVVEILRSFFLVVCLVLLLVFLIAGKRCVQNICFFCFEKIVSLKHMRVFLEVKQDEALRQLINKFINQSANASTLQYYMFIDFPLGFTCLSSFSQFFLYFHIKKVISYQPFLGPPGVRSAPCVSKTRLSQFELDPGFQMFEGHLCGCVFAQNPCLSSKSAKSFTQKPTVRNTICSVDSLPG